MFRDAPVCVRRTVSCARELTRHKTALLASNDRKRRLRARCNEEAPMNAQVTWLTALAGMLAVSSVSAQDDDDEFTFQAFLSGAQEVTPPDAPATPSLGVATDTSARTRIEFSREDRKSTRLNSSHVKISYAVFCLKK